MVSYTVPFQAGFQEPTTSMAAPALSFSGGGSTSASLTKGILRALLAANVLHQIPIVATNSGSSWLASVLGFEMVDAQQTPVKSTPLSTLLGTALDLGSLPSDYLTTTSTRAPNALSVTCEADLVPYLSLNLLSPDGRAWCNAIGDSMLAPFGLFNKSMNGVLTTCPEHILQYNLNKQYKRFIIPRKDFPMVTFLATYFKKDTSVPPTCMDFSAYSIGTWNNTGQATTPASLTGRVAAFAFDAASAVLTPDRKSLTVRLKGGIRRPITLADFSGCSSNILASQSLPQPTVKCTVTSQNALTLVGDGGILSDSSLLSLVARGRQRIICFLLGSKSLVNNTQTPWVLDGMFGGQGPSVQVFERNDLSSVMQGLRNAQVTERSIYGKPAIYTCTLNVLPNTVQGFVGIPNVRVTFVYNTHCDEFFDQLPSKLAKTLSSSIKGFPNVPFYNYQSPQYIAQIPKEASLALELFGYYLAKDYIVPLLKK